MNYPAGLPNSEFIDQPITQAEIASQTAALDAIDDIEHKTAEYNKSIQDQETIRQLGAMLVGDSDPSRQE